MQISYTYDNLDRVILEQTDTTTYEYFYDSEGNLAKKVDKTTGKAVNYQYDSLGRLIHSYQSDGSSIVQRTEHIYDTSNRISSQSWQLGDTTYSESYAYDAIGNPTNWYNAKAWNFTWQNGRQLATAKSGSTTISYTYDVAGIRDSKTVGSTVYNYLTQNGQVVQQSWNGNVMDFIYDENSRPYACIYKDALYYYVLNLQGDVIGLVNTSGAYVAKYTYDAWGRLLSGTGTMASTNPLRYRGYYYDNDTKLYYLGSRYYDPQVKRFINADGLVSTGQDFTGYNMFAYCGNNPVNYYDLSGWYPAWIDKYYGSYYNYLLALKWQQDLLDKNGPRKNPLTSKEYHYSRNQYNYTFSDADLNEQLASWDNSVASNCHQFSSSNHSNTKYVSQNGHYEVILDSNGKIVTDPRDVGTYNFCSPQDDVLGHAFMDVIPWILYGNSPSDNTSIIDRIGIMLAGGT